MATGSGFTPLVSALTEAMVTSPPWLHDAGASTRLERIATAVFASMLAESNWLGRTTARNAIAAAKLLCEALDDEGET